jgi:BirA family transcriptional regulator, biotin operon repressor / biotin---[acetyl-CoA-carboxylase] ligase
VPVRIETVAETGSTSADLLARLATGEHVPEGHWLVAGRQTAGRGRQGRRWLDAPGNFMGSTAVHLSPQDPLPATLSFVAALSVYEAVLPRLAQPLDLRLKWPNDVLLRGAKFCGILLEREGEHAVVGIGVNLAAAPAVPDRSVRSLADEGPAPLQAAFATELAFRFDEELARWRQFGLGPTLARWLAAAHSVGSALTVHDPAGERIAGTFEGIEPDGALRLRLADGSARVIHAGDVTLEGG